METAEAEPATLYDDIEPVLPLGLPLVRTTVSEDYFTWLALPELFPVSFPGVQTGRDTFLVDTDLDRLKERVGDYFNTSVRHERDRAALSACDDGHSTVRCTESTPTRCSRVAVQTRLASSATPIDRSINRWLYWEAETKLLREKSPRYPRHVLRETCGWSYRTRRAPTCRLRS